MRLNEKIGFEMRNQRLLHRMTLEQVADKMGIASKNTISGTRTIVCGFIKSTFLYISLYKNIDAWSEIYMHECIKKA